MADVVLNLRYNDNGAQASINNLIRELEKIENRQWRVNLSGISQEFASQLEQATKKFEASFVKIGGSGGIRATFDQLQTAIRSVQNAYDGAMQKAIKFAAEGNLDAAKGQRDRAKEYKDQLDKLQGALDRLNAKPAAKELRELGEAAEKAAAQQKEAEKSSRELATAQTMISQGYAQAWRGIQRTVTGAVNVMTQAYNTWKSVAEAPLNLTGVSSLVSMIESMEGSLLLSQIGSNITSGFSAGLERFDVLRTFPQVISNIGYSTTDAQESMDRLYQSVLGLPTAFSDIVESTQFFTLMLDDLEKATDLAIAANNAFVASGADSSQTRAGMRQLQYILEGTQLRSTQWYSLIRSMPLALREVGDALGYPDFRAFTADLMANKIEAELLIDTLIDVGLHSEKLGGILEVMKERVTAALTNVRNAAMRMGESLLGALDETLTREGGKGIADNIKEVSSIIDRMAQVGADWIRNHGAEIQALLDKLFAIDWESLIPNLFENLIEFASNAIDNIGDFISDIGSLLRDARQFFNDLENNRGLILLKGIMSGLPALTQMLAGVGQIYAGLKLAGLGNALASSVGGSVVPVGAGLAGASGIASYLPAISGTVAGISALIFSIKGTLEAIERENKDYPEFTKQQMTRSDVQSSLSGYIHAIDRLLAGESLSGDLSIDYLVDRIWSESGQKYALPYLDEYLTTEALRQARDLALTYYNEVRKAIPKTEIDRLLEKRGTEDILRNEMDGFTENIGDILSDIDKGLELYHQLADGFEQRLNEIDRRRARIEAQIEELKKNGIEFEQRFAKDYQSMYGGKNAKGGKFFSKQVEESDKNLYRNTLADYTTTQEQFLTDITTVNNEIIEAIENYDGDVDKSLLYETWANMLGSIDPNDPEWVGKLQKIKDEGAETILSTLIIPTQRANEISEQNASAIWNMQVQSLELAKEQLDSEEDVVVRKAQETGIFDLVGSELEKYSEVLVTDYLPLIKENIGLFEQGVIEAINNAIENINRLRLTVAPSIRVSGRYGSQGEYYASGGYLFQPIGTDIVPAMLTPGEYVQRRAAVNYFGREFMERINQLDLRGALKSLRISTPYSGGGLIHHDSRMYRDNHATVNQVFNSANASTGYRRASRFVRALG